MARITHLAMAKFAVIASACCCDPQRSAGTVAAIGRKILSLVLFPRKVTAKWVSSFRMPSQQRELPHRARRLRQSRPFSSIRRRGWCRPGSVQAALSHSRALPFSLSRANAHSCIQACGGAHARVLAVHIGHSRQMCCVWRRSPSRPSCPPPRLLAPQTQERDRAKIRRLSSSPALREQARRRH